MSKDSHEYKYNTFINRVYGKICRHMIRTKTNNDLVYSFITKVKEESLKLILKLYSKRVRVLKYSSTILRMELIKNHLLYKKSRILNLQLNYIHYPN